MGEHNVRVRAGERMDVHLPDGMVVTLAQAAPGSFTLTSHMHGDLVRVPGGYANVHEYVLWPHSQPLRPPTPDSPLQVPHALVREVMAPFHNGVGPEAVAAVQAALDGDPDVRKRLIDTIHGVLTKRPSGSGYESVYVRQDCAVCRQTDTDDRPVDRRDGEWAHEACREARAALAPAESCKRCGGTERREGEGTVVLTEGGWMHLEPCWTAAMAEIGGGE